MLHLLRAPGEDRRTTHADPDDVVRPGDLVVPEHVVDVLRLARREREPGAVLGGPGRCRQPRLAEADTPVVVVEPGTPRGDRVVIAAVDGLHPAGRELLGQPGPRELGESGGGSIFEGDGHDTPPGAGPRRLPAGPGRGQVRSAATRSPRCSTFRSFGDRPSPPPTGPRHPRAPRSARTRRPRTLLARTAHGTRAADRRGRDARRRRGRAGRADRVPGRHPPRGPGRGRRSRPPVRGRGPHGDPASRRAAHPPHAPRPCRPARARARPGRDRLSRRRGRDRAGGAARGAVGEPAGHADRRARTRAATGRRPRRVPLRPREARGRPRRLGRRDRSWPRGRRPALRRRRGRRDPAPPGHRHQPRRHRAPDPARPGHRDLQPRRADPRPDDTSRRSGRGPARRGPRGGCSASRSWSTRPTPR